MRISGRAKLSGVETDMTYAELARSEKGRSCEAASTTTRDEALEAAGLSE